MADTPATARASSDDGRETNSTSSPVEQQQSGTTSKHAAQSSSPLDPPLPKRTTANNTDDTDDEHEQRTVAATAHAYATRKGLFARAYEDLPWAQRSRLNQWAPFRGMIRDVKHRLPFYWSDYTTAFEPRNIPTMVFYVFRMYFINLMPAIAYVLDMYHRTHGAYGVNEVVLASALAAIVFPILGVQPLTFVGITGLINLVNYTQYDIVVGYYGLSQMDYLRVQAWSLIWSAAMHFLTSIFNINDFVRFITDMTSETFGFYVSIIYIQKGIELLLLEFEPLPLNNATGWLSVTIAILFTVSVCLLSSFGKTSYLPFQLRHFIASFAFVAGILFWTGFSNFPENSLRRVPLERLPITRSWFPTMQDRPWFIDFWNIEVKWVFVGLPFGFLITLLFWFDHNVSAVMAQARSFPVRRPAGFHWDFFLLGVTTLVSGFLGLPAPNGLVPQCPWSTESLSVFRQVHPGQDREKSMENGRQMDDDEDNGDMPARAPDLPDPDADAPPRVVNVRLVEQRVGYLVVGLLTLGTMTRPLLVVLGTMPRALFAGVFIQVGWTSIEGNGITTKTIALFRDPAHVQGVRKTGLYALRRSKVALFVGIQWLFFAMTMAISQTIAGIGFPVIITLLVPTRYFLLPRYFTKDELDVLDAPTANAAVVWDSIGGDPDKQAKTAERKRS